MSAQFATQSIVRYVFVATAPCAAASRAREREREDARERARDIARSDRDEDTARGSRGRARRVRRAGIARGAGRARWMGEICAHVLLGAEARRRGREGARARAMGAWVMWWLGISRGADAAARAGRASSCARGGCGDGGGGVTRMMRMVVSSRRA